MPKWTNDPPKEPRGPGLPLRRCPPAQKLEAIVTSDNLIGCPTHYFRSRTIPCEKPNCEPCDQGFSWRWHGYLTAVDTGTSEHFIFEMTAAAAEAFTAHRDRYDTLRGCHFRAHRPSRTANGRVIIQTKPGDLQKTTLPDPPNVTAALTHIWNIPTSDTNTDRLERGHPHLRVEPHAGNNHPAEPSPHARTQ